MAIWQFRLTLIPVSALRAKFGVVPISVPEEPLDTEDFTRWWSDVQPTPGFEAKIGAMLSPAKSWSEDMLMWGDEESDDAYVCYDDDRKVEEIGFRIDVRVLSLGLVRGICALAKDLDCMILTRANHVKAPDEQVLLAAIHNSAATRFLRDPVSTLLSLKPTKSEVVPLRDKRSDPSPKDGKG